MGFIWGFILGGMFGVAWMCILSLSSESDEEE